MTKENTRNKPGKVNNDGNRGNSVIASQLTAMLLLVQKICSISLFQLYFKLFSSIIHQAHNLDFKNKGNQFGVWDSQDCIHADPVWRVYSPKTLCI